MILSVATITVQNHNLLTAGFIFCYFWIKLIRMKYRFVLLYITLLLQVSFVSGQYYDTGEDPASLKWLQIKTKRFTVIYPESYGAEGMKFAMSLDESYSRLSSQYSIKNPGIPVIIHNYTSFSNGYVAWAPRRIEIYPTPEQNTIPLDPVEQITIHELTHVLQMYSLKKGFSNIMTGVFGEQFTGAISVLLPMWFMEGDAVFSESVLSGSGRGRVPSFQKQLKAIDLERSKMYSYDKMVNGSFRNYTPDHYHYGYQMVAWSYAKYDPKMWKKTLELTAKQPFIINPVNVSLKKSAGLTKAKLFFETFDSLKTLWKKDESILNTIQYEAINPSKKGEYVDYYSPVVVGKDSLVAIKTSFYNPPSFVLIDTREKSEKKIHIPGDMYPWFLSGSNGKIVWVENYPDPRWENRDYSVIKIMDIKHRKTLQLSHNSRFTAASISPDGRLIAAAENTVENKNSLVIIDSRNGDILNAVPLPGNVYPQRPQWSASGDEITVISLSGKGEGILSYSLKNQIWQTLMEAGTDDLQSSLLRNDSLFFISSCSGTDNIYVLSPGRKTSMLTNSRFGSYDLYVVGNTVYFSDYSFSGNNISQVQLNHSSSLAAEKNLKKSFLINRFDTLKYKSADSSLKDYNPLPYRKWQHLFKFHSWMPFYADIQEIQADPSAVRPGFTIMTQNNLSTLISTLGYEYSSQKSHLFHSRITWKGWYPIIETQLDYGGNPDIVKTDSTDPDPSAIFPALRSTNTIYLPLNFSSGKFSQYIQVSLSSRFVNSYIYNKETMVYNYGQTLLTGRLYFSSYHKAAIRDIFPGWAQAIDYSGSFYLFEKGSSGNWNTLKTVFYFPGLLRNQSIKIRLENEIKPEKYLFYNRASFPRSYKNIISQNLKFCSVDYTMPLLYPDLNVPGFFYLKRVRGGLYYDYARGIKNSYLFPDKTVNHNYTEIFRSFGFELLSDFYLLRIPFMISGGVQAAWKNFNEPPSFEMLFNIDIFGMKIGTRGLKKSL